MWTITFKIFNFARIVCEPESPGHRTDLLNVIPYMYEYVCVGGDWNQPRYHPADEWKWAINPSVSFDPRNGNQCHGELW